MNVIQVKQDFLAALRPMMDLFDHKRSIMPFDEWIHFVYATRDRVVYNPEQFLGRELPAEFIIHGIVDEIFTDYLAAEDQPAVV